MTPFVGSRYEVDVPEEAALMVGDAVPTELRHFLKHGLGLDKEARFESAAVALAELHQIRAGDFQVQCPLTFKESRCCVAVSVVRV